MTEYTLSNRIAGTLLQIKKAIEQLQDWNKDIQNVDDYYSTPEGMKNLAASCMLIEAIGEGVKQIDKLTQSRLLDERPEIPWQDVIGIRNHIAHGYFDIDGDIIKAAKENAKLAGVDELIHFQKRPVSELNHPKKYGFLVSNPPYGERIGEKEELPQLYRELAEAYKRLDSWSAYIITGYTDVEKYMGRKADKNRKIYNGMMKTYYYQFLGPKPPRR